MGRKVNQDRRCDFMCETQRERERERERGLGNGRSISNSRKTGSLAMEEENLQGNQRQVRLCRHSMRHEASSTNGILFIMCVPPCYWRCFYAPHLLVL